MGSILHDIEDSLIRYCEVISQVIELAVTIVDNEQIRIIYRGKRWKFLAGVSMKEKGNIARMAIDTQESQIMLNPKEHPACLQCPERDNCKENVEAWVPIIVNGSSVGAVGLVCETKRQEQRMRKNCDNYLRFLEQIAGLISYEAIQHLESQHRSELVEMMEMVVNQVDSGVVFLGQNGTVLEINRSGQRILRNLNPNLDYTLLRIKKGKDELYEISDQQESCTVEGKLFTVKTEQFHAVLIFQDDEYLRKMAQHQMTLKQIVGTSAAIQAVRKQIKNIANSTSSVLIQAENGLGKELYARAIHDESEHWNKPFVRIDCADLPKQDPEKYLFGVATISNAAGTKGKPGRIEAAIGGTLFLDNVDALPLSIQRKMVWLLEKREIVRVGAKRAKKLNIRVIASTNRDLSQACETSVFSKDLYYLLNIIPIRVPPLRERKEDIRPLAIQLIRSFSQELHKPVTEVEDSFWQSLEQYDWPGNGRELSSAIEFAINMMGWPSVISADLLPKEICPQQETVLLPELTTLNLKDMEREVIRRALKLQREKRLTNEQTAQILGIGATTFYRKLKDFHLK